MPAILLVRGILISTIISVIGSIFRLFQMNRNTWILKSATTLLVAGFITEFLVKKSKTKHSKQCFHFHSLFCK